MILGNSDALLPVCTFAYRNTPTLVVLAELLICDSDCGGQNEQAEESIHG